MANTRKPKAKSLFEQARQAKPRTECYHIPLVDHDEGERLWAERDEAIQALKRAVLYESEEKAIDAARKKVSEAQAAFDEGFRTVVFRGLPPKDVDVIANEHPDPDDGEEPEGHVGFIYHLAVACCDEDVTAEQWKQLCDEVWPTAEGRAFRQAVLDANYQPYSAGLGKG
jgi:hypothetical protein